VLGAVAAAGIGRRPQAVGLLGHVEHLATGRGGGGDSSGKATSAAPAGGRQTGEGTWARILRARDVYAVGLRPRPPADVPGSAVAPRRTALSGWLGPAVTGGGFDGGG